ncbi:GGDEF domain-containing protein [Halioxenophilus aromaticivorans]|uniref:diguanylate cyclase n=1 Tax=Halioxenophilus aromaticivorans TaxID=1306992 RepID=A0AAV3U903_9ALTE
MTASENVNHPYIVENLPCLNADGSYIDGVNLGFQMAAQLAGALNHHAMTCAFLNMVEAFPGVQAVHCYEVFNKACANGGQPQWLFRRFPLTLDDNYEDENTNAIVALLFDNDERVLKRHYQGRDLTVLRVDDVTPKRVVLIEGALESHYFSIIEGLYSVYARQTSLLDTKERDSLTHLLNRQSLEQTLSQVKAYYLAKSLNNEVCNSSWLAVLDIDKFKQINDTYGHIFGDEVLIHFANVLNEEMRFSDFLFRFGGEEFIIILNQVDAAGAATAFERYRKAVENYRFPAANVTVSIGYTFIDHAKANEQLLEEADKAVYAAKTAGRNQVVNYQEMDHSGEADSSDGDIELF